MSIKLLKNANQMSGKNINQLSRQKGISISTSPRNTSIKQRRLENISVFTIHLANDRLTFMAEARHAKLAAEDAEKAAASSGAPGGAARQAIGQRKSFTGGPIPPLPPKRQRDELRTCQRQSRDARAESRGKEKDILIAELTAKAEAKAEQRARVAYHHAEGL